MPPRNLVPGSAGHGWSGSGTTESVATPAVPIAGMDRPTAGRVTQGAVTGNSRISAPAYDPGMALGGLAFAATVQGEADPVAQATPNPVCASATTGWSSSGGTAARVTGLSSMVATTGFRVTVGSSAAQPVITTPGATVAAGRVVSGTLQVRCSVAATISLHVEWLNSSGARISTTAGTSVQVAAGGTTVLTANGTAPANTASVRLLAFTTTTIAANAQLTATGARSQFDVTDTGGMVYGANLSCALELTFRDASGAALSTVTGSTVSIASGGAAVRAYVTGTAPAGTRRVQVQWLTRATAARQNVYATAARIDQESNTALGFFDAASSGWRPEGPPTSSASRQITATWFADTDSSATQTENTAIGYKSSGSQRQIGPPSNSFNDTSTPWPLPVLPAPGGRPGRAVKVTWPENYSRVEQNPNHGDFDDGADVYFGFAFYLDADFPLFADDFQVIEQLHAAPSTGSPPVAFEVRGGEQLRITGGANKPKPDGTSHGALYAYDRVLTHRLERQRWYAVVYRVQFSRAVPAAGGVWVWLDGVPVLSDFRVPGGTVYGTDVATDGGLTYRKQGLYHRPRLPKGTIWHAGAALGADFYAADPARGLHRQTSDVATSFVTAPWTLLPVTTPGALWSSSAAYFFLRATSTADGTAVTASAQTSLQADGDLAFTSLSWQMLFGGTSPPPAGVTATVTTWIQAADQPPGTRLGIRYNPTARTLTLFNETDGSDPSAVTIPAGTSPLWATEWQRIRCTGAWIVWETASRAAPTSWVEARRTPTPSWALGKNVHFGFSITRSGGTSGDSAYYFDNLNIETARDPARDLMLGF